MIIPLLAFTQSATQMPFVSPIFGDHMVIQRDKVDAIWGWTKPGEKVSVSIGPDEPATKANVTFVSAVADTTGKWVAHFKAPKTGGPYAIAVSGSEKAEIHDVLVGDIWVCSGQSNMEMGVSQVKNAKDEIAAANHPNIRLFAVPKSPSLTPKPFVKADWLTCTPENIVKGGWGGFSAVAYFFGRDLNAELNVPIGLIHTSWGGTPAEAWTSEDGIAPVKDFQPQVNAVTSMAKPGAPHTAELIEKWAKENGTDLSGPDVDDSAWDKVELPARFGMILLQHHGELWFRKTVDLPDPLPAGDAQLTTGSNDGVDLNYVNGVRTDFGSSVLNWRNKPVPAGVLKPGKNVIAIHFIGGSGFAFPGIDGFNLRIGGTRYPLMGEWKVKKGFELKSVPAMPPLVEDNPNWPTTLYNGMIYPLAPFAIKGAIWYQGESNVGRAEQYSRLLPAMITDWRKTFGQGDFPFFVVQLANFGRRNENPSESGWAELREAQTKAVQSVKSAGMAVTADIGEAQDIHPKNKQDVGKRLALSALKVAYGKKVEYTGPTLSGIHFHNGQLLLTFVHANGMVLRAAKNSGFAIAGADGKCFWADAKVDGNTVVLSSPNVPNPVNVRYGWDDDPVITLYNEEGLPAVPFRTK